jgi:hypothetical protein
MMGSGLVTAVMVVVVVVATMTGGRFWRLRRRIQGRRMQDRPRPPGSSGAEGVAVDRTNAVAARRR